MFRTNLGLNYSYVLLFPLIDGMPMIAPITTDFSLQICMQLTLIS